MAHQQLHTATVAEIVGFQLIGQVLARGRRRAVETVEVDGVDNHAGGSVAQVQFQVAVTDHAPAGDGEFVVEHRFGKALPPRATITQLLGQFAGQILRGECAIAQQFGA